MIQNESMAASSSCSRRRHDDNNISTTASQIISAVAIAIGCIICLMLLLSSSNQSNNHRSSRRLFATYFSNDENYELLASATVAGTAEKTPSETQLLAAQQDHYNRRQLSKHLKQLKQDDPTQQQQQPQYHVDYTKYSCDSMNDPSLLTKLMLQQEQKRVRLKETDENNNSSDKIDDRKTSSLPTNNEQPQQQQQQQLLIDKCQFAKTCNDGQGVGFGSRLFCSTTSTSTSTFYSTISNTLTIILLLTTLLLLFRLLNSTTDEFFSPGLELFSLKLGLPPRFAGVTLLALGNGAPDVAATMNATLDSHEGYLMALGELTGTSMFVSGVILGVIVSLDSTTTTTNPARRSCSDKDHVEGKEDEERGKDGTNTTPSHTTDDDDDMIIQPNKNETRSGGVVGDDKVVVGVPCQGPLLRDIAMLMLVCIVSMSYLERGVVDYGFVHTLLAMYAVYVLTVLGADIYHLFYHLPMVRRSESGVSLCNAAVVEGGGGGRGSGEEDDGHEKNATVCSSDEDRNDGLVTNEQTPLVVATTHQHHDQHQHNHQLRHHHSQPVPVHHHSIRDSVIEAMSNYSCDEERQREEQIIIFHPHHAVHPHHENGPMLLRDIFRRGPVATRRGSVGSVGVGKTQSARQTIRKSVSDGITSFHSWSSSNSAPVNTDNDVATSSSSNHAKQMISSLDDVTTPVISGPLLSESNSQEDTQSTTESQINNEQSNDHSRMNASATKPNSWGEAWKSNVQEFKEHWNDFFLDIYCNEENGKMDVILLSMELPFTIIRKLATPVPCDGYYCRPLVALSVVLSPIWLWYYFKDQFEVDLFSSYIGYVIFGSTLFVGLAVMRFAPGDDGPMELYMVIPLTLYGFAIAATWLDSIADKLVELLELFGILLEIPRTIMGLTVLAFGNSSQDLIANVSLSRKGLSTMAVTACLAGPIFNLCIGLSLGFMALLKSTGKDEIHVKFPGNIKTGFYFTLANCALIVFAGIVVGKGVIGKGYGYLACGLYVVYVLTSLNI